MNETELSRLIVRLTGDGSEFQKMLKQAEESAARTAESIEHHGGRIEKIGESIKSVGENTVRALEAFGMMEWLKEGFSNFQKAELQSIRLNAAIRMGGHDVAESSAHYKEFAETLADTTMQSKNQVLQLLRAAEVQGLSGDAAEEAAKKAVALAASQENLDPKQALRIVNAMEQGNMRLAMSYGRMVEGLRHITDASQFSAKYQQLLNVGWATAREEANSTAGSIKKAAEAYEHFKTSLGGVLAESLLPFIKGLGRLTEALNKMPKEVKIVIVTVLGLMTVILAVKPIIMGLGLLLSATFSPIGILIVGIGVYLAAWSQQVGGIANAWVIFKQKAVESMLIVEYSMMNFDKALQLMRGRTALALVEMGHDFAGLDESMADLVRRNITNRGEDTRNAEKHFARLKEINDLNAALKADITHTNKDAELGFSAWKEKRLKELANKLGDSISGGMGAGIDKGLKKIEAALSGSAEARTRMENYLDVNRFGTIHKKESETDRSYEQIKREAEGIVYFNEQLRIRRQLEAEITESLKDQGAWMKQNYLWTKMTFEHNRLPEKEKFPVYKPQVFSSQQELNKAIDDTGERTKKLISTDDMETWLEKIYNLMAIQNKNYESMTNRGKEVFLKAAEVSR